MSSPGSEILDYFKDVTKRHELEDSIRFGEPVVRCEWRGDCLEVESGAGFTDRFDWVIAATGILHYPKLPKIGIM